MRSRVRQAGTLHIYAVYHTECIPYSSLVTSMIRFEAGIGDLGMSASDEIISIVQQKLGCAFHQHHTDLRRIHDPVSLRSSSQTEPSHARAHRSSVKSTQYSTSTQTTVQCW